MIQFHNDSQDLFGLDSSRKVTKTIDLLDKNRSPFATFDKENFFVNNTSHERINSKRSVKSNLACLIENMNSNLDNKFFKAVDAHARQKLGLTESKQATHMIQVRPNLQPDVKN